MLEEKRGAGGDTLIAQAPDPFEGFGLGVFTKNRPCGASLGVGRGGGGGLGFAAREITQSIMSEA